MNTIEVMAADCLTVSVKVFIFNLLFSIAIKIAPKAPSPEASVGEAIPKIMLPKTVMIKINGGAMTFIKSIISIELFSSFEISSKFLDLNRK